MTALFFPDLGAGHRPQPRPPARDEGQDPAHEAQPATSERRLQTVDRVARAMEEAPDGIGEGDRALIRQPRKRLGCMDRLEVVGRGGGRQRADLDRQHTIRAAAAADLEEVLKMLDRLGGTQQGERALELIDPHDLGQVAAHQGDAVLRRELPLPAVGLDLEGLAQGRRDPALSHARVLLGCRRRRGQLVHPRLADDDRGRGAQLRDVRLTPADGDRDHAHPGAARDPQLSALVVEAAVGIGEGLAQCAECAGGEVVVVVVLQGFEGLRGRPANRRVASGHLRQQEEAALGPNLGTHCGLSEPQHVTRVGGSLLRHRESDTGCESIRHAGSSEVRWMERGPGRCRL